MSKSMKTAERRCGSIKRGGRRCGGPVKRNPETGVESCFWCGAKKAPRR